MSWQLLPWRQSRGKLRETRPALSSCISLFLPFFPPECWLVFRWRKFFEQRSNSHAWRCPAADKRLKPISSNAHFNPADYFRSRAPTSGQSSFWWGRFQMRIERFFYFITLLCSLLQPAATIWQPNISNFVFKLQDSYFTGSLSKRLHVLFITG